MQLHSYFLQAGRTSPSILFLSMQIYHRANSSKQYLGAPAAVADSQDHWKLAYPYRTVKNAMDMKTVNLLNLDLIDHWIAKQLKPELRFPITAGCVPRMTHLKTLSVHGSELLASMIPGPWTYHAVHTHAEPRLLPVQHEI